jgi:hypothetical protein
VAALTMPALVVNYQKKVVVTRLQKFDSIVRQIHTTNQANGESNFHEDCCTSADTFSPDFSARQLEHFFQHAKYLNIKKLTKGAVISFPDGSGAYLVKPTLVAVPEHFIYTIFCPDYKKCEEIDESKITGNNIIGITDSRNYFAYVDLVTMWGYNSASNYAILEAKSRCNNSIKDFCAATIKYNGWQISPDYPW